MKIRLSEIIEGSCFIGRNNREMKKTDDGRIASISPAGRVTIKKAKGNPEVEQQICSLKYLGVGLRRHPDLVVEIGDGNILKKRKR